MLLRTELLQFVHEYGQATLQVRGLVEMDHIRLRQLIQHGYYCRKERKGFLLTRQRTQFAHCITSSLVVITVAQTLGVVAADALEGGLVIGHSFLKTGCKYTHSSFTGK
jgi:hypothetical protein